MVLLQRKIRLYLLGKHRFHFFRRSRHHNQNFIIVLYYYPRRRSVFVIHNGRIYRYHSLFNIIIGHRSFHFIEKLFNSVKGFFIQNKFSSEIFRSYFLCKVVPGWSQASRSYYNVGSFKGYVHGCFHSVGIIADNCLVKYVYSQFCQSLRYILCVCINNVSEKNFRSDCKYFRIHAKASESVFKYADVLHYIINARNYRKYSCEYYKNISYNSAYSKQY